MTMLQDVLALRSALPDYTHAAIRLGKVDGAGGQRTAEADLTRQTDALSELLDRLQIAAEALTEEGAEDRWHRAVLRRHMAVQGLEDPTWANLSAAEKAVLRAADDEVLAASERQLPPAMRAA